jgi:hypothetical protein
MGAWRKRRLPDRCARGRQSGRAAKIAVAAGVVCVKAESVEQLDEQLTDAMPDEDLARAASAEVLTAPAGAE